MPREKIRFSTFILILFFVFVKTNAVGQNIALHKPYTLSEIPNYKLSAPADDTTALTDGKYTKGYFWIHKTTVGWYKKARIKIDIDLEKREPVGVVNLSSAAGKAGVKFPKNIYVFVSDDGIHFEYAGDAVGKKHKLKSYENRIFSLNNIDKTARYVSLVIIPNGKYFFTDEIEVLKSKNNRVSKIRIQQKRLISRTDNIVNYLKNGYVDHNKPIYTKLQDYSNQELSKNNIHTQSTGIPLKEISNVFKQSFVVEKFNPWGDLSDYYIPKESEAQLDYNYSLIKGQHQYGAFVITNTTKRIEKAVLKRDTLHPSKKFTVQFYEVPFVYTYSGVKTPDPLIPLKKEGITLAPGESQMILFKLFGMEQGISNEQFEIKRKNDEIKIAIKAKVQNLIFPDDSELNANVWTYLNYPLLRDKKETVSEDIQNHGINTIVLNWSALPKLGSMDFSTMITYLNKFRGVENILLFYNFKNELTKNMGKDKFLSDTWKKRFKKWYATLEKTIHKKYSKKAQVYFYPYDEISDPSQIEDFKRLIEWSHKSKVNIKYYATLGDKNAIEKLLPLLDIAQIYSKDDIINNLPKNNAEIWSYKVARNARSLSPYVFYRLMSWQAFYYDFKGVGFWNYADTRKGNSILLNKALMQSPNTNYSAVYFDVQGTLYSSRRWEAFSKGIEDYKVLSAYAEKYGQKKTKSLVKEVLDNTSDALLADKVLKEILQSL